MGADIVLETNATQRHEPHGAGVAQALQGSWTLAGK